MVEIIEKDPEAVLDYTVDWTLDLVVGDPIAASSFAVPAGITKDSESDDGASKTTVFLSGGMLGEIYDIVNHITTVGGREDDKTFKIKMTHR